jgi:hypothetical protein
MKASRLLPLAAVALPLFCAGCLVSTYSSSAPGTKGGVSAAPGGGASEKADEKAKEEAEIKDNLAELSPEDRKLAEAQKYCVMSNERLGTMGPPVKILVKDQPVFLCCGACKKDALKNPDETLAKVTKAKEKAAEEAKKK